MYSFWARVFSESFKYTTATEPYEKELDKLVKEMTPEQEAQLKIILQYKDVFIASAARSNYEKGFLDGIELLSAVCHRHWNKWE